MLCWKTFMGSFGNFREKIDPWMKFFAATPKVIGCAFFRLTSFISRWASRLANPFDLWMILKRKKKIQQPQFHHIADAKPLRWLPWIFSCREIFIYTISCVKYGHDWCLPEKALTHCRLPSLIQHCRALKRYGVIIFFNKLRGKNFYLSN